MKCKGAGLYVCDQELLTDMVIVGDREITIPFERCAHCRRLRVIQLLGDAL
jgi:hypothetical protein